MATIRVTDASDPNDITIVTEPDRDMATIRVDGNDQTFSRSQLEFLWELGDLQDMIPGVSVLHTTVESAVEVGW